MAQQDFAVGAGASTGSGTTLGVWWNPPDDRLVDAGLLDGGGTAYLRRLLVQRNGNNLVLQISLNPTDAGSGSGAGPDFTTAVEGNPTAYTLTIGTQSWTFDPTAAVALDPNEPYGYTFSGEVATAIAITNAYAAASDEVKAAITFTVDDGVPDIPDADAPTITVDASDANEGQSTQITPTPSGGTYDTLTYEYEIVSGGGSVSAAGLITTPQVSADTVLTYRVRPTAAGTGTNAADGTSDVGVWVQGTLTVRNVPVTTTDTDSVYMLADRATAPTTPTGGTTLQNHTPTGWTRTEPDPTDTLAVWRSQRTRTFVDGAFTSATAWGAPTRTRDRNLTLSDWSQPSGTDNLVLALLRVDVSGSDFIRLDADPADLLDGEVQVASDLTLTQLERQGSDQSQLIRLRKSGAANFSVYFGPTAQYPDAALYIQTDPGTAYAFTHNNSGGGFSNWNADAVAAITAINGLVTGDRIIVAITTAAPPEIDFTLPAVTGGLGVAARPSFTVMEPPQTILDVTLPAVTGGLGAAARPDFSIYIPPEETRLGAVPRRARFFQATSAGPTSVLLEWSDAAGNTLAIDGWQVSLVHSNGTVEPFTDLEVAEDGDRRRATVRGLRSGVRYGFRVRPVGANGVGDATPYTFAAPLVAATPTTVLTGQRVPLVDAYRQSLVLRVDGQDVRVHVWWQPRDESWYGGLEVPVNTVTVMGRRLANGAGLLDGLPGVLAGNFVLRDLGGGGEPGLAALSEPTHGLFWEAS